MELEIKGFIETSFCDWDGNLSSVVFLPGCNFRCPFCQNRELVLAPQELPTVPFEVIRSFLHQRREWIDGVVVTGGEPTLWKEQLDRLMGDIRAIGPGIKLDTNGSRPDDLERLIDSGLLDFIAMDIKAPLDERYSQAAGVPVRVEDLKRSIRMIREFGAYEFRTTMVPGIVGEAEVMAIAEAIDGADRYALQRFVPDNSLDREFQGAVPYDDGFISRMVEIAETHVGYCFYRGKVGVGLS
jgi:pyruvate formate lyase activating enzyme